MTTKTFKEFRRDYEEQHPASVPVLAPELSPYPGWLKWATLLMFFSSAMLSGVHTVPVVRAGIPASIPVEVGDWVSLTAFMSVELAILLSAYAMIGGGGLVVSSVLFLATGTALVANIYSVILAYQISMAGDIGTLTVAVIVGVVAPGIALLSGKLFVKMHRAARAVDSRAKERHRLESQAWDTRIADAWDAYRTSVQNDVQAGVQSDADSDKASRKSSSAASIVREHLAECPDDMSLSVRELASKLDVSSSTAHIVRRQMLAAGHENHNGHH